MKRLNYHGFLCAIPTLLLLFSSSSRAATVVFEDTFDSESLGLGFTGSGILTNWDITAGNIDVIGPGLFNFFPGNGRYLDMGGISANGVIQTNSLLTLSPGLYELSFELAFPGGFNQNVLGFSVGTLLVGSVAPPSSAVFTSVSYPFNVTSTTSVGITFAEVGPLIDDGGTILNDVRLTLVPEPATLTLLTLASLTLLRRRERIRE